MGGLLSRPQAGRIAAELFIVVAGVMIALAADSWRETMLDARVERDYVDRLRSDLEAGLAILHEERERFAEVAAAAWSFRQSSHPEGAPADSSVSTLIAATLTGFDRQQLASDVTYQELVASGRLSILRDQQVREEVVAYYRAVDRLAMTLEELPKLNHWVGRVTGYFPYVFQDDPDRLDSAQVNSIVSGTTADPELRKELNLLHAQLLFVDRLFASLLEQGRDLVTLLQ